MKKVVCFIAVIVAGACAWMLGRDNSRLRVQIVSLEDAEMRRICSLFRTRQSLLTNEKCADLTKAYSAIAEAYEGMNAVQMRTRMLMLPEAAYHIWNVYPVLDLPLRKHFDENFLRTENLHPFSDVKSFDRYVEINLMVAMFYGRLYLRQKNFESLCFIEHLVYLRLKQYHDKFEREKETDLQNAARRFMDLWEAQIESPDGFTRQGIRGMYLMNSVYARACGHGPGLTRENALVMGRALANGLVKCGYRPKWLDHLGDVLDEPWDGILPDDYKESSH